MPYYTLYAVREVAERCIIKAKNESDAIEKSENEQWEVDQDISWEITSVNKESE